MSASLWKASPERLAALQHKHGLGLAIRQLQGLIDGDEEARDLDEEEMSYLDDDSIYLSVAQTLLNIAEELRAAVEVPSR